MASAVPAAAALVVRDGLEQVLRTGGGGERCRCHGPAVGCENGLPTAPIVELRIRVRLGGDDGVALGVDRKPFDNQEFSLISWTGRSLPPESCCCE